METRRAAKRSFLTYSSITLTLSIILFGFVIYTWATTTDYSEILEVVIFIIVCVGGAFEILTQLLGIIAILQDHYCGSIAYYVYQIFSLTILAGLSTQFSTIKMMLLLIVVLLKIAISILLCKV